MKKIVYSYPQSGFLSTEKDMSLIVNFILKNERLKRLLYYTTSDCLQKENLTEEESIKLFGDNIKTVPWINVDGEKKNYLVIKFDNFVPNENNPEFRDNLIEFDIVCHYDLWQLKDFELRPYKIAAELDSMLNNQHLSGIGTLRFVGAKMASLQKGYGGLCVMYAAVHGEEDKKNMPNPLNEEDFVENYDAIFNN